MHGSGIGRASGGRDRHANQATRSERVGEVEHVDAAGGIAGNGNAIGTNTDDFGVVPREARGIGRRELQLWSLRRSSAHLLRKAKSLSRSPATFVSSFAPSVNGTGQARRRSARRDYTRLWFAKTSYIGSCRTSGI